MDLPNSRCSRFVSCRCKRNLVHRIFGQLFLRIRPATPLQVTLAASLEKASVVLRFRERADVLHGPKLGAGPPFHLNSNSWVAPPFAGFEGCEWVGRHSPSR